MTGQIVATRRFNASTLPYNACFRITSARFGLVLPLTDGPDGSAYISHTSHLEKHLPLSFTQPRSDHSLQFYLPFLRLLSFTQVLPGADRLS